MVAIKDDTHTLEAMADMLVAGKAEHATDAIRKLGFTSEAAERRLLRKWATKEGRDAMLAAGRRAHVKGFLEGHERASARSWFGRLFWRAASAG